MKMHKDITEERIVEACERRRSSLDDPGFCVACGQEQGGCEPDMRRGLCESCGERKVYGVEELLMHISPW